MKNKKCPKVKAPKIKVSKIKVSKIKGTVQVQMSNGWTYVYEGAGSYTSSWKR